MSSEDFQSDEWLRPPTSQETKTRTTVDQETRIPDCRPRRQKPPEFPGNRLGAFEMGKVIGAGSHGWVFESVDSTTGRSVALKVLDDPSGDPARRAKTGFRRMSKLRHRGLMRLHRITEDSQWVALALERIEGRTLATEIVCWRKLPLDQACERLLEMIRQVSSALAWMHARRVVHRDIKPSNVMWSESDQRFVLIDFDLVGTFDPEVDPAGIRDYLVWTPRYVAPEVLFRQSYGPASDVFSLGTVVLESLRIFSSFHRPQSDRDQPIHDQATREAAPVFSDALTLDRDEDDIDRDEALIRSALSGLHRSIPDVLIEAVKEMLAPDAADRPMAIRLSRLGLPPETTTRPSIAPTELDRVRSAVLQSRQTELETIGRWSHWVLARQIRRLHIEGPSGIGKSTLIDVAIEQLQRQPWVQVFVARCQRREQRPLAAFSQIADAIVQRFRRSDRQPMVVDTVTESILTQVLPGFASAIRGDASLPGLVTSPSRPGGLEAAQKICDQLRQMGPLIFVIDDLQWADQDTLMVLDHLQTASVQRADGVTLEGLGIVTVSRVDGDLQRVPPDEKLIVRTLQPWVTEQVLRWQADALRRDLSTEQINEMVDDIQGLPYRLDVYLSQICRDEATPGLSPLNRPPQTIEELWRSGVGQLDDRTRQTLYAMAVCGRQLGWDELIGCLGGPADLERQLDDLADRQLIQRDGADGQVLRMWHDRLSQQVLAEMPADDLRAWHLRWAEHLPTLANVSAAEVADHYDQTGNHDQFVVWAERAAADARNLMAHVEAGRWHMAVADRVSGARRVESLRLAAGTLRRGGRLDQAAEAYGVLATCTEGEEQLTAELDQVDCLLRSGHLAEMFEKMPRLLARLNLPYRKSKFAKQFWIAARLMLRQLSGDDLSDFRRAGQPIRPAKAARQIAACSRLIRPMAVVDNLGSMELSLLSGQLVRKYGQTRDRVESAVSECVFRSYFAGRPQREARRILIRLQSQLVDADDPSIAGDIHCGQGWVAAMSGQWTECLTSIEQARHFYSLSEEHKGFELAHVSFAHWWALFHTGQIANLINGVEDMTSEGAAGNDQFVLVFGTFGFAAAAHLANDWSDGLELAHRRLAEQLGPIGMEAFGYLESIKDALAMIYRNDVSRSIAMAERLRATMRKMQMDRAQAIRIVTSDLTALLAIQLAKADAASGSVMLRRAVADLRRQKDDFATMKANFYEATTRMTEPQAMPKAERTQVARLLQSVITASQVSHCAPMIAAAEDALQKLETGQTGTHLVTHLQNQNVTDPERFARLYRGL